MVATIQLELAERIIAKPWSKDYSALSAWIQVQADAEIVREMAPSVFWPVPRVESGLVAFTRRPAPHVDRSKVFAVIDAAFAHRRKMLRSALAAWAGGPEAAVEVLRWAGVAPTARGEELDVAAFASIAAAGATMAVPGSVGS